MSDPAPNIEEHAVEAAAQGSLGESVEKGRGEAASLIVDEERRGEAVASLIVDEAQETVVYDDRRITEPFVVVVSEDVRQLPLDDAASNHADTGDPQDLAKVSEPSDPVPVPMAKKEATVEPVTVPVEEVSSSAAASTPAQQQEEPGSIAPNAAEVSMLNTLCMSGWMICTISTFLSTQCFLLVI